MFIIHSKSCGCDAAKQRCLHVDYSELATSAELLDFIFEAMWADADAEVARLDMLAKLLQCDVEIARVLMGIWSGYGQMSWLVTMEWVEHGIGDFRQYLCDPLLFKHHLVSWAQGVK